MSKTQQVELPLERVRGCENIDPMDHLTRLLLDAQDGDGLALERFIAETQGDVWTWSS